MPAAPAAAAPAAPAAPAKAPVAAPAKAPAAPVKAPAQPAAPAVKPMDRAFERLNDFATDEMGEEIKKPEQRMPEARPAEPPAPEEKETPPAKAEEEEAPSLEEQEKQEKQQLKTPEEKRRESPWKLVNSYKARAAALEKEIADLRTKGPAGELPKEVQEKLGKIEARNKELEEEIRFVNYKKSEHFIENYQKPFETAWERALSDLHQLTITLDDGTTRVAKGEDLVALSNLPLGQARATAKQWFGDAAEDIMAHRRTLRELSDKQARALDDAQKNGSEREAKVNEERSAAAKARAAEAQKIWQDVNAQAQEKYEYLRPVEGATERNEKLEKAVNWVDETLKLHIGQAKTQEERDQFIKRHAALRNRAIAFSVLRHENVSLKSEMETLKKSLAEYQGSEPTAGEHRDKQNGESADPMERMMSGIAKLAS